jgi:hypothetical protein
MPAAKQLLQNPQKNSILQRCSRGAAISGRCQAVTERLSPPRAFANKPEPVSVGHWPGARFDPPSVAVFPDVLRFWLLPIRGLPISGIAASKKFAVNRVADRRADSGAGDATGDTAGERADGPGGAPQQAPGHSAEKASGLSSNFLKNAISHRSDSL